MGKRELSGRENWQEQGGAKASKAEKNLYVAFYEHFHGTEYILHEKPKHLKNLYAGVTLPDEVISQIFNPSIDLEKIQWGVSPDFAIENTRTHKILFGEIKRQDGWKEKTQVLDEEMHMKDCANCLLLVLCRHIEKLAALSVLKFFLSGLSLKEI